LRQAIAATYSGLEPDQVLAFCGAEEGLYCAMHALLGRDDHAIVTTPNYQAMEELPLSLCQSVSPLALRAENQWDLDLDELRSLLRPNTRLLAVNFPNNPTGKVLCPERWSALLELVRERQIWLFSDEVYRGLERDPAHTLVQAAEIPQAFATGVVNVMVTSAQTGVDSQAWDFAKVFTPIGFTRTFNTIFVQRRAFDALPAAQQQALREAATRAEARGWQLSDEAATAQQAILGSRGMTVAEPTPALLAGLAALGQGMADEWAGRAGEDGKRVLDAYRAA
jgi:hypothetical protein